MDDSAKPKLDRAEHSQEKFPSSADDVGNAHNASGEDLKTVESSRTNSSDGSLRDRQRLLAEQDASIEIVGFERKASRTSPLTEKDFVDDSGLEPHSTNPASRSESKMSDERSISEFIPQAIGPKTFALGLSYSDDFWLLFWDPRGWVFQCPKVH